MYGYVPAGDSEAGHGFWDKASYAAEFAEAQVRQGFVRKVFGILAVQLLITVLASSVFIVSDGAKSFVQSNPWTVLAAMLLVLGLSVMLSCFEGPRKTFPWNYVLLLAFTGAEAFLVGTITAAYETQVVVAAAGITVLVTAGLTAFACQTKYDFTAMGGVLLAALLTLVGASLVMAFFPATKVGTIVISSAGALVFSAYLVFDIQLIMGGRALEIGPDDYVLAALCVYIDVINLFLYILNLINAISGNRG